MRFFANHVCGLYSLRDLLFFIYVRGFSVYYSCLSTVCAEQASAESGEWVDEAAHAWDGGRATASGMMEAGVTTRWQDWHNAIRGRAAAAEGGEEGGEGGGEGGAFLGLRVALYGDFDQKEALARVLPPGGAKVLAVAPPFAAAIAQGLDCVVLDPSKVRFSCAETLKPYNKVTRKAAPEGA